jgi:urease beta subunit
VLFGVGMHYEFRDTNPSTSLHRRSSSTPRSNSSSPLGSTNKHWISSIDNRSLPPTPLSPSLSKHPQNSPTNSEVCAFTGNFLRAHCTSRTSRYRLFISTVSAHHFQPGNVRSSSLFVVKCRRIDDAERIFATAKTKDVLIYGAMIKGPYGFFSFGLRESFRLQATWQTTCSGKSSIL